MMTLTTRSKKLTDNTVEVSWKTGEILRGILTVTLHDRSVANEITIAAELAAIYHLIYERNVFNRTELELSLGGNGFKLDLSHGAIKKLIRSEKNKALEPRKRALWNYAAFLKFRLDGVTIAVNHSMNGMPGHDDENIEVNELALSGVEFDRNFNVIETKSIGKLVVTRHAIEQYIDRTSSGAPKHPIKSLIRQLNHPNLVKNILSKDVLDYKERKYGRADNIEVWSASTGALKFFVLVEDEVKTLVTVYERNSMSA